MQANEITLPIDELNNGTPVNKVYKRFDQTTARSTYIGPEHGSIYRDKMSLFRASAKPNGNFAGVEKTSIKFTIDKSVSGVDGVSTLIAPAIVEASFSLPVGITEEDKLVLRQTLVAALDHTFTVTFQSQLDI